MLYFLCPDHNQGSAGTRKIYKDVLVLNQHGVEACVLHEKPGFEMTWFEPYVPVRYVGSTGIDSKSDVLVIPEIYGSSILTMAPGCRKVIFNQNYANSWAGFALDGSEALSTPYLHSEVIACLCASEENQQILEFAFFGRKFYSIRYSVDPKLFYYQEEKKKQIAFMTHKRREEIQAVTNMLALRGNLKDFKFVSVENRTEKECAQILRDSAIFLSFSFPEGWPLVTAEALASGCTVVGYFSPVYFRSHYSHFCQVGNLRQFVEYTELAVRNWEAGLRCPEKVSEAVLEDYSLEKEEARTLEIWKEILDSCGYQRTKSSSPRFSVIIPVFNNLELTKKCVESVWKCSDKLEVIMIDNGSDYETEEWLRNITARNFIVLRNHENLGFSRAINQGAKLSRGEYLVLLNSDAKVCEGWLEKMAAHLKLGVGAVGPISPNGTWHQSTLYQGLEESARFLTFFCVMIPRKIWDEIGELDERFFLMAEDLDYSIRLRKAGYSLVVARDVVINHEGGASFKNLIGGGLGSKKYSDYATMQDRVLREKWGSEEIDRLFGDYGSPLAGKKEVGVQLRKVSVD